jgi:DNA-binding NarL/FixJ family response regulator
MIKVIICDDQMIVCEGLQRILGATPDIKVVGTAHNGQEALDLIPSTKPDLVLMDLKMPLMNGIIATRKIREQFPDTSVLVLTTYDDDEWVFDAVRAGANGYLLKDTPPPELIKAIQGTVSGQSFIDPNIAGKLLSGFSSRTATQVQPTNYNLSERETEILRFLTQGLSNADIAQQLYLTEGTVRNYTSEIFKKLGVNDRTQAAVVALKYGLVDIE